MLRDHANENRGQVPRRRRPVWPFAVAALCVVVSAPATDAWGSFSSQTINNSNSFSSGTVQLEGQTSGSVDCYSTGSGSGGPVGTNNAICSGTPLPSGELTSTTVVSASMTLNSVGSSNATAANVSLLSCGVAQVADSSSSADTGLVYGGTTYGTAFTSPVNSGFTSTGITLDGATGSFVGTIDSLTSPATFTIVAWVKTTSTSGGSIIGFATKQYDDDASNHEDRMLWVDPSGFVVFGVQKSSTQAELTSSVTVNDGNWHFVAATFSATGLSLDVDGHMSSSATLTSLTSYTGYWHLGWSGNGSWTDAGSDEYLAGSLYGVAVLGTALSSSNLTTLNDAVSTSTYTSGVNSFSPTGEWLLSDGGTTPYTGTISNDVPCQRVLIDIQTTQGSTTACAYPAGTGACSATLPNADLLSSLTTNTMAATSASSPVTVLVRMELKAASPSGVLGLHLLPDIGFTTSSGTWSAEVTYPASGLSM